MKVKHRVSEKLSLYDQKKAVVTKEPVLRKFSLHNFCLVVMTIFQCISLDEKIDNSKINKLTSIFYETFMKIGA